MKGVKRTFSRVPGGGQDRRRIVFSRASEVDSGKDLRLK